MTKLKQVLRAYVSLPAAIFLALAALSLAVLGISCLSPAFADFFTRNIAGPVRAVLATVSGIFPCSLAETVILLLPLWIAALVAHVVHLSRDGDDARLRRFFVTAFSAVTLFFTLFIFTYGVAYHGSTLDEKLGAAKREVSAAQLERTASLLAERVNTEAEEVSFVMGSSSVMPYDFAELNRLLNDAFARAAEKYPFIFSFRSRCKPALLSEGMSYAHLLGMYTYYTGEANINVVFPDYTTPYTCAHEMSHQRGIAREDEANFMAYLVCRESEDAYIRYSGEQNLLEYVLSALYSADKAAYRRVVASLSPPVRGEMRAYSDFYEKYEQNKAAQVTDTLNDHFLKANGQSAGTRSYGLVVDLAVAYLLDE